MSGDWVSRMGRQETPNFEIWASAFWKTEILKTCRPTPPAPGISLDARCRPGRSRAPRPRGGISGFQIFGFRGAKVKHTKARRFAFRPPTSRSPREPITFPSSRDRPVAVRVHFGWPNSLTTLGFYNGPDHSRQVLLFRGHSLASSQALLVFFGIYSIFLRRAFSICSRPIFKFLSLLRKSVSIWPSSLS